MLAFRIKVTTDANGTTNAAWTVFQDQTTQCELDSLALFLVPHAEMAARQKIIQNRDILNEMAEIEKAHLSEQRTNGKPKAKRKR